MTAMNWPTTKLNTALRVNARGLIRHEQAVELLIASTLLDTPQVRALVTVSWASYAREGERDRAWLKWDELANMLSLRHGYGLLPLGHPSQMTLGLVACGLLLGDTPVVRLGEWNRWLTAEHFELVLDALRASHDNKSAARERRDWFACYELRHGDGGRGQA